MKMPELTYRVVAYEALNPISIYRVSLKMDFVNWALELLENGCDSKNAAILAGSKKSEIFEILENYFKNTLKDFGLKPLSGEDAKYSYAYYHVLQISRSINLWEQLHILDDFYCQYIYDNSKFYDRIENFSKLLFAWKNIEDKENNSLFCDPHTTGLEYYYLQPDEIEVTAINLAKEWIEEYVEKNMLRFYSE